MKNKKKIDILNVDAYDMPATLIKTIDKLQAVLNEVPDEYKDEVFF
jgi:hypothetical protein